ncbi:hypothetical protein KOI35_40885 [Actinoplanes bogorensis]|uniref:Uncharacterized protein n=1 Tax=Paractinoplanes bogorensis TaxID=1610840 RepID=A0ABS5Z2Z5_9ACTN|nr:hypothetical protein [Actinoplanes bogorensis]MBU2669886.1 hypothetical protein [Actinoplanes bogorensis]
MSDDHERLRRAMSDLAEHGGGADLYERTLRKSRQSQRRARWAATGAAAVAVFAVGGAVAYATVDRSSPALPPAFSPSPSLSTAPSSAPPSSAPPTPSPPHSSAPPSSSPHSSAPTSDRPRYPDCPSAKALEKLADLPKDWYFVPSSVKCWRDWAMADPEGPTPSDGIYLFHYKAGPGWSYHSQGSSYRCPDLGITSGNPPFCETG